MPSARKHLPFLWIGVFTAVAAAAHVNDAFLERGFKPEGVYSFHGLDAVNNFNGNLTLSIPLGPSFPQGGGRSFGLQLTYNSQLWDFQYWCGVTTAQFHSTIRPPELWGLNECLTLAHPDPDFNAGLGWSLELGRLVLPDPGHPETGGDDAVIYYRAPDGGRTAFFPELHPGVSGDPLVLFSRSGSYLKLEMPSSATSKPEASPETSMGAPGEEAVLHLPDGSRHLFVRRAGWDETWFLSQIVDTFGNTITVDYPEQDEVPVWVVTDAHGRVFEIEFYHAALSLSPESRLKEVRVPATDGRQATYTFRYDQGAPFLLEPGCPANFVENNEVPLIPAWLLTGMDLPEGESFEFAYETAEQNPAPRQCSHLKGKLLEVTLPTKGKIEYEYGNYHLPRDRECTNPAQSVCPDCYLNWEGGTPPRRADRMLNPVAGPGTAYIYGVSSRTLRDREGNEVGQWLYKGSKLRHWMDLDGVPDPVDVVGSNFSACQLPLPPRPVDYDYGSPGNEQCDFPTSTYTDVIEPVTGGGAATGLRRKTRTYYSIFNLSFDEDDLAEGWLAEEYGLPINRSVAAPADELLPVDQRRYLSTSIFLCDGSGPSEDPPRDADGCRLLPERETFVSYAIDDFRCGSDGLPSPHWVVRNSGCQETNRRVQREITYYCDDTRVEEPENPGAPPPPPTIMFTEVERSDFDGLGHYRSTETNSNFVGGDVFSKDPRRTERIGYNLPASSDLPSPWLLNLYKHREVILQHREGAPEGEWHTFEDYDFDPATGFLREVRTRRAAASEGNTDFLVRLTADSAGNVANLSYLGGDAGVSQGGSEVVQYQKKFSWSLGTLTRSEWLDSSGQPFLLVLDRTLDSSSGAVVSERDATGEGVAYTYDLRGRRIGEAPTDSREAKLAITYEAAEVGSPATVRVVASAAGAGELSWSEFLFDDLGRLSLQRRKMPGGIVVEQSHQYSAANLRLSSTVWHRAGANGVGRDEVSYDVFSRPIRTQAPDGSVATTAYLGVRERRETILGLAGESGVNSAWKAFTVDHRGNLTRVVEPSGAASAQHATDYYYDARNQLRELRISNGGSDDEDYQYRAWAYDSAGVLLRESHPEMKACTGPDDPNCWQKFANYYWSYGGYDALRNPGEKRLQPGPSFLYDLAMSYDRAGRPTEIRRGTNGRLLNQLVYARANDYGVPGSRSAGRLVLSKRHHLDPDAASGREVVVAERFDYRGLGGRLSAVRTSAGGNGETPRVLFETEQTYDPLGRVAELDYPMCRFSRCGEAGSTASALPARELRFDYDFGQLSRMWELSDLGGAQREVNYLSNLSYDANGLRLRARRSNGLVDVATPDASGMGRAARLYVEAPSQLRLWDTGTYQYDGAGNIAAIGADEFRYDRVHRLVRSSLSFQGQTHVERYEYDEFGNLTAYVRGAADPPTQRFNLDVDRRTNRLAAWQYDVVGNATPDGSWTTFRHDPFNLVSEIIGSGPTAGVHKRFLYNAAGERVATLRVQPDGNRLETTHELWTLRGAGTAVLRDVERLEDGSWRWRSDYLQGPSGPVAEVRAEGSGQRTFNLHLDHLGSVRLVTGETGNVVSEHKLRPYGEELGTPSVTAPRLRFTGHERDDLDDSAGNQLADLDYMHARYYAPVRGRFLSLDPVQGRTEEPQTWNRYGYVTGRPITMLDPDGRAGINCIDCGYESVGAALRSMEERGPGPITPWDIPIFRAAVGGLAIMMSGGAVTPWVGKLLFVTGVGIEAEAVTHQIETVQSGQLEPVNGDRIVASILTFGTESLFKNDGVGEVVGATVEAIVGGDQTPLGPNVPLAPGEGSPHDRIMAERQEAVDFIDKLVNPVQFTPDPRLGTGTRPNSD